MASCGQDPAGREKEEESEAFDSFFFGNPDVFCPRSSTIRPADFLPRLSERSFGRCSPGPSMLPGPGIADHGAIADADPRGRSFLRTNASPRSSPQSLSSSPPPPPRLDVFSRHGSPARGRRRKKIVQSLPANQQCVLRFRGPHHRRGWHVIFIVSFSYLPQLFERR